MKKWLPHVLLVALLVTLALVLRGRDRLPKTPEATFRAFFDAASEGDDRAYLRLVTGELRESLEHARSQSGPEAFRRSLRRSTAGATGHATERLDDAPPGMIALDVTLAFADRNETQRMLFAPIGGGWAIASIDKARVFKPPIPYGTPVYEEPADAEEQDEPTE